MKQLNNPKVLLVEDFEDTRQMMRQFLELGGCRVLEAANGREAIEVAERESPELILMDLNMPVLDGFTATVRIRENERLSRVPIVALTAFDTTEFRAAAKAIGCNEYVSKPIDFAELMTLLENLLPEAEAASGVELKVAG
ncbi:MAG TPA: response regulator [Pyrinomonadaceae bacterium]|jgi:CheY-like chemotaxis protein